MSLYRRFVTYLFRYENGRKENGCGFAKLEVRQGSSRMELQLGGCADGIYTVYLFHAARRGPVGVKIGELRVHGGSGREMFMFRAEAVGDSPYTLDQMSGIYMTAAGDRIIISQWDDEIVNWDVFHVYGAGQAGRDDGDSSGEESDELQEEDDELPEESGQNGEALIKKETSEPEQEQMAVQITQVSSAAEDVSDSAGGNRSRLPQPEKNGKGNEGLSVSADIFPCMSAWEKQWQRFCALHPVFCPFDEIKDIYAVKMDLRDLRILPKQYHSLANNSFLLHGYFNYKYLLFGHMDEGERRWFIAVPGVFQNQEQLLAGIFGFTEFQTKHVTKQRTGEFGFWYRWLEL